MASTQGAIVFLTPGSSESLAALPGLATFAAACGEQLTILHLSSQYTSASRVSAAVSALAEEGTNADLRTISSDRLGTILEQIATTNGGMVALLPRRAGMLDRLLSGSEYEQILSNSPLPILALPAGGLIRRPARVLFPADLAPRSAAAFQVTVALCRRLGAELHVLHVFGDDRILPEEQDQERRRAVQNPRELFAIDQALLRDLAAQATAQGVTTQIQTAEGRAHTQILKYAASAAIDLIVMASHGPRTIEDIVRGSTTVRVVQDTPVAVLAMHG